MGEGTRVDFQFYPPFDEGQMTKNPKKVLQKRV
jgi:hypothetical protein